MRFFFGSISPVMAPDEPAAPTSTRTRPLPCATFIRVPVAGVRAVAA